MTYSSRAKLSKNRERGHLELSWGRNSGRETYKGPRFVRHMAASEALTSALHLAKQCLVSKNLFTLRDDDGWSWSWWWMMMMMTMMMMMMTMLMMSPPKHLELIIVQFTFLLLPAQESNQAGIFAKTCKQEKSWGRASLCEQFLYELL